MRSASAYSARLRPSERVAHERSKGYWRWAEGVHAHDAPQMRVGGHQRHRSHPRAPGGAQLRSAEPLKAIRCSAAGSSRAASRSKATFAAHVLHAGERRVRGAMAPASVRIAPARGRIELGVADSLVAGRVAYAGPCRPPTRASSSPPAECMPRPPMPVASSTRQRPGQTARPLLKALLLQPAEVRVRAARRGRCSAEVVIAPQRDQVAAQYSLSAIDLGPVTAAQLEHQRLIGRRRCAEQHPPPDRPQRPAAQTRAASGLPAAP